MQEDVIKPLVISSDWQAHISSPMPRSSTGSSIRPDCECGVPAIRKMINLGNAKGRDYWSCPIQEDGCSFFEYVEGPASPSAPLASSSTINIPAKRPHSSVCASSAQVVRKFLTTSLQTRENENSLTTRRCLCMEDAAMHTVSKEGANKGRRFWKCTKGDELACKFWEWDDEPGRSYGPRDAKSFSNGSTTSNSGSGSASDVCFKVRLCRFVKQLHSC